MRIPEKAPETEEPETITDAPEEPEEKPAEKPAQAAAKEPETEAEPPHDRESLDALVKKIGADAAIDVLKKVRVVDLRSLAREYNGEFGIAGREIRNANKKILIEEFRKFFTR